MTFSPNLPAAEAEDAADVALALETARSLWAKGQGLESVRWIQRAAQGAESAGNDLRAVSLARAAADLRAEVSVASEPPGAMNEGVALMPYDDFSEQTIVDSPVTAMTRQALQSGVHISDAPRASPRVSVIAPDATRVTGGVPTLPSQPRRSARHEAVRVAVLGTDGSGKLLSVRVLNDAETAPPGSQEALLVALDPTTRWLWLQEP